MCCGWRKEVRKVGKLGGLNTLGYPSESFQSVNGDDEYVKNSPFSK